MSNHTNMTNEAREARNEYARAWRAKNRDKVRESNARYWEKKATKEKEAAAHAEHD